MYGIISICANNFLSERIATIRADINNFNADILTILFLKVDIFGDDGIVGVAKDKEFGLYGHG